MKIGTSQTLSSISSNSASVKNDNLQGEFLLALVNAIENEEITSLNNEINIDKSLESDIEFESKTELIDKNNEIDEKLLELISSLFNSTSQKVNKEINIYLDNNTQIDKYNSDNNAVNNVVNKQEILDIFVENTSDKNNIQEDIQVKKDILGTSLDYYKIKDALSNLIKQNSNLAIEEDAVLYEKGNLTLSNDLEIMSNFRALSIKEDELIIKEQDDFSILNNIVMSKNNIITEVESKISEPKSIRSQYISEDFVQVIKYLKENNIEEVSVKMNPKDLGELNIKLIKSNGEERIIVTLGETDTFNLLKDKINDIKAHLNTLDINVKEISVEIKSNNENNFSQNLNQQFNRNNNKQKNSGKYVFDKNNEITEIKEIIEDDNTNINLLI